MRFTQADLFAQDAAERNTLSQSQRVAIRARLEATLARLEAAATFPWRDPLDAVHEENRFQRDTEMLGEEGALLWRGSTRKWTGCMRRSSLRMPKQLDRRIERRSITISEPSPSDVDEAQSRHR